MKNAQPIFLLSFILSLIVHLLIVLSIYYPDTIITLVFTSGMFFAWLFVSKTLKELSSENSEFQFSLICQNLPAALKYTLMFFALFAFINFAITLSFDSGNGWAEFNLGHDKLRGISGFWLIFYLLAFSAAYLKTKIGEEE